MKKYLLVVVVVFTVGIFSYGIIKYFRNIYSLNSISGLYLKRVEQNDEKDKLLNILGLFTNKKICLSNPNFQRGECRFVKDIEISLSSVSQKFIYISDKKENPIITWSVEIVDEKLIFTISYVENRIPINDKKMYLEKMINALVSQQLANMVEDAKFGFRSNSEELGRMIDISKVKFVTLYE